MCGLPDEFLDTKVPVLAPDVQRTGHTDGDLGHADEIFDVTKKSLWVEGVMSEIGEIGTSHLWEELPSESGHFLGIVVSLGTRNADPGANFRGGDHRPSRFARQE